MLKDFLKLFSVFVFSAVMLNACMDPPNYSQIPEIQFKSFSPQLVESGDTLVLSFTFKDGDGDLGFRSLDPDAEGCDLCDSSCYSNPDFSIFVTRSQTGCLIPFNLPYIPPKGSSKAISGTVRLFLFDIQCVPEQGGSLGDIIDMEMDQVSFDIMIRDRAGNKSNVITTPLIDVKCN